MEIWSLLVYCMHFGTASKLLRWLKRKVASFVIHVDDVVSLVCRMQSFHKHNAILVAHWHVKRVPLYKNTASSRLVEKISPCTVEEFEPVLFIICYPTVKALRNPSVNRLTSLVGIGVNLYWSKGSTGPQILATWDLAWPSPPFWHEKQKNTDIFSLSFNTLTRQSGLESSV